MKRWFNRVVLARRWATFLVMGLAFFCFGLGSLNLFLMLASGYASMAGYVVFKACEHSLVRHIVEDHDRV